ncbi:hypothetical protein D4764_17G0003970 [Takifugu flavidus]|uniref:Uncharacterized protein n=1 Tax=Takifugu flavidus TaxID=433684 RepID=A0A5C6NTV5_9TELE|nr:hypothetical protein D4764_17G0003970 [Takifugu flavidus]
MIAGATVTIRRGVFLMTCAIKSGPVGGSQRWSLSCSGSIHSLLVRLYRNNIKRQDGFNVQVFNELVEGLTKTLAQGLFQWRQTRPANKPPL